MRKSFLFVVFVFLFQFLTINFCIALSTNSPLVSIIIPVYNTEQFLEECLNSIVNQTYKNLEIILINDGSTDSSMEICKRYQKKDKRIILISQENKGAGVARNKGLDVAKGEYITFVDSDDFVNLKMIETFLKACLNHNVLVALANYYRYINNVDKKLNIRFEINNGIIGSDLSVKCIKSPMACSNFYHKSVVQDIRFPGTFSEDFIFWYQVISKRPKIIYIYEPLYYYRLNALSRSNNGKWVLKKCTDRITNIEYGFNLIKKSANDKWKIEWINEIVKNYDRFSYEPKYTMDVKFRKREYEFLCKLKKYKDILTDANKVKLTAFLLSNKIPFFNKYIFRTHIDKHLIFIAWILEPLIL